MDTTTTAATPTPTPAVPPIDPIIVPPMPPANTSAQTSEWMERVSHLAKGKEGLLIAASVPFLLGYGTTLWNAYKNNLGFIPPLQAQCLLAGLLPTLVLIAAIFLVRLWLSSEEKLTTWYTSAHHKNDAWRNIVGSLFKMLALCGIAYQYYHRQNNDWWLGNAIGWLTLFPYISLVMIKMKARQDMVDAYFDGCLDGINEAEEKEKHQQLKTRANLYRFVFRSAYVPTLAVALFPIFQILIIGCLFWTNYAYPHLPQEFGGGQPRMAFVAVTRAQLSPEMRGALLPKLAQFIPTDPSKDPLAVAQSVLLDVVYENSDALMVRVHDNKATTESPSQTVFQIKKSSIQGVTWRGFDDRK